MLAPVYSAFDYLQQFLRLLPRGRVWQRGWGSVMAADLYTLMPTWARLHMRANDAIEQAFPCTTTEMLPEWEASLGLPDPCTGPLGSLQARTAAVCAKFTARGGQSQAYFIELAARLGYTITIDTFVPFYASQGRAGDPVRDEQWAFAWRINVSGADPIVWFRASVSAAQEPLAYYEPDLLQCEIERLKPAHTQIIWAYQQGDAHDTDAT